MENMGGVVVDQEAMDLPPGFRFHPSDEELITHYLAPKVVDNSFSAVAIGEVDLNKSEPWELPGQAKMGEKEWYFFCVKDRKYPTGMRTNRATHEGYWKATGKDKEIYRGKSLVGMKKTLVFYKGRAPKGVKSNWVMHEYRLDGKTSLKNLPSDAKNEWVICRVFHKSSGGKKLPFPGLISPNSFVNGGNLPPLMESSPGQTKHVSCFSNPLDPSSSSAQTPFINNNNNNNFFNSHNLFASLPSTSNPSDYFSAMIGGGNSIFPPQPNGFPGNFSMSDQQILRDIIENSGAEQKQSMKTEGVNYSASQETCFSGDINAEISNYYIDSRPFDDTSGFDSFLNY